MMKKLYKNEETVLMEEPANISLNSKRIQSSKMNKPEKKTMVSDSYNQALSGLLPKHSGWRKNAAQHNVPNESQPDVLIFRLTKDFRHPVKTEWANLSLRQQEIFTETLSTTPENFAHTDEFDGCYTFTYSDANFSLSILLIVAEGKRTLFYKPSPHKASISLS